MKKKTAAAAILLLITAMCFAVLAQGMLPGEITGHWTGTGIPKNNGTPIDLELTVSEDGTGEYVFVQGSYRESFPFTVEAESGTFSVDIPAASRLGKVEGTWALENGALKLDITSQFAAGGSYSYSAVCTKTAKTEDVWICPECGSENSGNFCENDAAARPEKAETWICPECGSENSGNFCENDAVPRPQKTEDNAPGAFSGIRLPRITPVVPQVPHVPVSVPEPLLPEAPEIYVKPAAQAPAVRNTTPQDAEKLNGERAGHNDYLIKTENVLRNIRGKVFVAVWDDDAADAVPVVSTDTQTGTLDFSKLPQAMLAPSLAKADTVVLIYPRYYEKGSYNEGPVTMPGYSTSTRIAIGRFAAEVAYEEAPERVAYHTDDKGFAGFDGATRGAYHAQKALDLVAEQMLALAGPESAAASVPASGQTAAVPLNTGVTTGDCVTYGSYPTEADETVLPFEWLVLDVADGKALLLSRSIPESRWFSSTDKTDSIDWENSALRKWMNGSFFETVFTEKEREAVLVTKVDNGKEQGSPSPEMNYHAEKDTEDKVFALSFSEAERYLPGAEQRMAFGTPYAARASAWYANSKTGTSSWWLRSVGKDAGSRMMVDADGSFTARSCNYTSGGPRPAVWVDLNKLP